MKRKARKAALGGVIYAQGCGSKASNLIINILPWGKLGEQSQEEDLAG